MGNITNCAIKLTQDKKEVFYSYSRLIESIFQEYSSIKSINLKITGFSSDDDYSLILAQINGKQIRELGFFFEEKDFDDSLKILLVELDIKAEDFLVIYKSIFIRNPHLPIFVAKLANRRNNICIDRDNLEIFKNYFRAVKDSDV